MIAPIFIRSETLSLKRNSKKTASVIFGKNVACNYCIEKTSRVILHLKNVACNYCIIPEKNVACNSDEKNGECNFEGKKTTSVMVKKTASVYSHGPSRPSYCSVARTDRCLFISGLIAGNLMS